MHSLHFKYITIYKNSTLAHIGSCKSVMGCTHAHTHGMIPCTPVLSQVIYYTYKKSDKWIHAHQSRSTAYTDIPGQGSRKDSHFLSMHLLPPSLCMPIPHLRSLVSLPLPLCVPMGDGSQRASASSREWLSEHQGADSAILILRKLDMTSLSSCLGSLRLFSDTACFNVCYHHSNRQELCR